MKIRRETMLQEAILEMKAMKLAPSVIRKFYDEGAIMVSDNEQKQYRMPLEDELNLLNEFKTEYPTWLPYLVVRTPHQLAIFAITPEDTEWPRICQELAFLGMGKSYIYDLSQKKSYGFFHVDFKIEDGLIFRTDDCQETADIIQSIRCPLNELASQMKIA